jgi:hypothetical protein
MRRGIIGLATRQYNMSDYNCALDASACYKILYVARVLYVTITL